MSTKDFSSKQENMIANYLDWKVVSGSGARPGHPGDIIGDDWLGECKTHEKSGHSIFFSRSVWEKIVEEATKMHRSPILFTDDGSQKLKNTWCIFNSFMLDDVDRDIKEYPKSFKTNITFKLKDLDSLYAESSYVVYIISFDKYRVAILPLEEFYTLFCK